MGIIGVIFAFTVHDQAFSMFAGLGTVGMFGVVVNDSLVVIDAINRAREKKGNLKEAAKNLYSILRKIKKSKYKSIAVTKIPNFGLGKTINDRLTKASKY